MDGWIAQWLYKQLSGNVGGQWLERMGYIECSRLIINRIEQV